MRKSVLCFLLLTSFGVFAQDEQPRGRNFEKGTYILGLNGSGSFGNGAQSRRKMWSGTVWLGYFPVSNLAIGARFSAGRDYLSLKNPPTIESGHDVFSTAPEVFARYYAPSIKIKPYVQVAAGYNFQSAARGAVKFSNPIGSVEGGILFPLGKRLGLEVSYQWRVLGTSTIADANKKGNLRLGLSFAF
jgi:hypothetical protein